MGSTDESSKSKPLAVAALIVVVAAIALAAASCGGGGEESTEDARQATQPDTDEALREEAFAVVRRLIDDFPGSAYPLGLMGTLHNNYGHTVEAEEWWRKCLEREPRRADVYNVLAMAALRKGEYEKVAELMARAEAIAPNMPGVHRRYAEALLEMGRFDEALAAVDKELGISTAESGTYILLGKIQLQRGDYEAASEAYAHARELQPLDSRPYYGLATAAARLGRSGEARQHMETFTRLRAREDEILTTRRRSTDKPRASAQILAETLVDAGLLYHETGQADRAEQYWTRAAEVDAGNTQSRIRLVDLYRRTQRLPEALEMCEQLSGIEPGNPAFHLSTGVLRARLRQYAGAEEALRRAVELAPRNAAAHKALVEVLLLQNHKLPEAKALADRLVELAPSATHYTLLGQACARNQDRAGAVAALERAVELAPGDQNIRQMYDNLRGQE